MPKPIVISQEVAGAIAEAVAYLGTPYTQYGKTVYILFVEHEHKLMPQPWIGDLGFDYVAMVRDAHGDNPRMTVYAMTPLEVDDA